MAEKESMSEEKATVLERANRTIESIQRRDRVGTVLRNSAHANLSIGTCGLLAHAIHTTAIKPLEGQRDALLAEVAQLREALQPIIDCYGLGLSAEKFTEQVGPFILDARAALRGKGKGE